AAEKRHEIRGVHENDVACALSIRRHPDEAVELSVSGRGENRPKQRKPVSARQAPDSYASAQ
ncbi:MAG: hypothetical protein WCD52_21095, partial [Xanthobacteraceae bacterium]